MRKVTNVMILGLVLVLAGYNTVAGMGEDITQGANVVGGWFQ